MITKNDCLILLSQLENEGISTTKEKKELLSNTDISLKVLEFIDKYRPLDIKLFYEKLRKSYNDKKSKLYKSIVDVDNKEPKDIIITLSSLLTQILLFSNNTKDRELFLKHSRAAEISKILTNYFLTYDLTLCMSLLHYIRADLKSLETLNNIK